MYTLAKIITLRSGANLIDGNTFTGIPVAPPRIGYPFRIINGKIVRVTSTVLKITPHPVHLNKEIIETTNAIYHLTKLRS